MKVRLGFLLCIKLYKRDQLVERIQLHSDRDRGRSVRENFGEEDGGGQTQEGNHNLPEERDRRRRQRDHTAERSYNYTARRSYNR